jgi:hypothetical protein
MTKQKLQKHYFLAQPDETHAKGKKVNLDFSEIIYLIINFNYSAGLFKRNFRSNKSFVNTDIIIFDIDDEQPNNKSILDVSNQLKSYKHILSTTKSHQISKNGIVCDRYRILFFLDQHINSVASYKATVHKIEQLFNLKTDPKTNSPARFYFMSAKIISSNENGQAIGPVITEKKDVVGIDKRQFDKVRKQHRL